MTGGNLNMIVENFYIKNSILTSTNFFEYRAGNNIGVENLGGNVTGYTIDNSPIEAYLPSK